MKKYKLLHGTHSDAQKNVYKKGDIVQSTSALDEIFVNKFSCQGKATAADKADAPKAKTDDSKKDDGDEVTAPEGTDVTDMFPAAAAAKLLVHKSGKLYSVSDPSDEEAGVLNDNDLSTKAKVNAFITEHTAD